MEKRRRIEEGYQSALNELKKKSHFGGPDYEVECLENSMWILNVELFEPVVSPSLAGGSQQPHQ